MHKTTIPNKQANKKLKKKYDKDPRVFWNDSDIREEMPSFVVDFSIFIFPCYHPQQIVSDLSAGWDGWFLQGEQALQLIMSTST